MIVDFDTGWLKKEVGDLNVSRKDAKTQRKNLFNIRVYLRLSAFNCLNQDFQDLRIFRM
jgi:hypothetical protein